MAKLSATIITFNEEKKIDRCLQSLKGVVDEIVVVDSLSTDKTREICISYQVVFIENPFPGYIEQKKIRPLVGGVYPLSEFHRAQTDFMQKNFVGKLVVVPDNAISQT